MMIESKKRAAMRGHRDVEQGCNVRELRGCFFGGQVGRSWFKQSVSSGLMIHDLVNVDEVVCHVGEADEDELDGHGDENEPEEASTDFHAE